MWVMLRSRRPDEALDELERCFEQNEIRWAHIEGDVTCGVDPDPDWDDLRNHPRYLALKAKHAE